MKITNVTREDNYRYIPLKGLDSVASALQTFASGRVPGSRETERNLLNAVGESGGAMGVGMFMLARETMSSGSRFVGRLVDQITARMATGDSFQESYDYDGESVFFKTSVNVEKSGRDDDMFLLGLYAAYVGDKPEVGLAETLGIPRALTRANVTLTVEPLDDQRYTIDFTPICERLNGLLPNVLVPLGAGVAATIFNTAGGRFDSHPQAVLMRNDDVKYCAVIRPGRVENRTTYAAGVGTDTWTLDGSTITGLRDESYAERGTYELPTWTISVESAWLDWQGFARPEYLPDVKAQMVDLADRIAAALAEG